MRIPKQYRKSYTIGFLFTNGKIDNDRQESEEENAQARMTGLRPHNEQKGGAGTRSLIQQVDEISTGLSVAPSP